MRPSILATLRCAAQVLALIAAAVYAAMQIDQSLHTPPTIQAITEWADTQAGVKLVYRGPDMTSRLRNVDGGVG